MNEETGKGLRAKPVEPYAWESTTKAFPKHITESTYRKLPSVFRSWYKPYRCSVCEKSPGRVNAQMLTALELLLARYVDLVNSGDAGHWDPESDGEVQLARAVIAAAKGVEQPPENVVRAMVSALEEIQYVIRFGVDTEKAIERVESALKKAREAGL